MIDDHGLERDLERRFVRAVRAAGWVVKKLEWVGQAGAPDRICLGPGGKVAFAELKNGGRGRISALQAREIRELENLGHVARVIRSDRDIEVFLRECL